jgi:hypothetical protein
MPGRGGDWTAAFLEGCGELDHVAVGESAFGSGPALWVGKREVAHLDDESTLDVRLTRPVIRARRAELAADERIRLRSGRSDWLEVRVTGKQDAEFALELIRDAVEANLPTAPPGLPPTGIELERRRRFH